MSIRLCAAAAAALICATSLEGLANPVTVNLSPSEDTFVYARAPNATYGTAGAMNISGPGTAGGPFDSAMKFDSVPAGATFNLSFGANNWAITSIVLQVTEDGNPPSGLFPRGAGTFQVSWLSNDNWSEGIGTPTSPGTASGNQMSYNYLQTLLGSTSQASMGTFANLLTDGRRVYGLGVVPGFVSDVMAGDPLTLLGTPVSSTIGFTLNSNNYFNTSARPVLIITADQIPEPATAVLLAAAALAACRRGRRVR